MLQDIRYAVRQLVKSPGFTLTAVVTLALGIGANTVVFSLVNALLLRPLPVERPGELVRVYTSEWSEHGVSDRRYGTSSYPDYLDFRARARGLAGVVAYGPASAVMQSGGATTSTVSGQLVSGNYFSVLGVRPALGRFFLPDEDAKPMASPVVVLGDRLWRQRFGADSGVVGSTVSINGRPFTVIGVAPARFASADFERTGNFFVAMAMQRAVVPEEDLLRTRGTRWLDMMARLAPGTTREQAEASLNAVMRALAEEHPAENRDRVLTVTAGRTMVGAGEDRRAVLGLAAAVLAVSGIVLLIASMNVANLLLARAVRRRREIAIRLSLGASRRRIVRQLLTESVLLALSGALPAVLATLWATDLVAALPLPVGLDPSPDLRVLAFAVLVAVGTGIVFGLAPALHATRPDVLPGLKDGGDRGTAARTRLRDALVIGQLALSLLLLAVGGLLVRSLRAQQRVDPGFDVARVLVVPLRLQTYGYTGDRLPEMKARILARVRALPGVEAAAMGGTIPLAGGRSRTQVTIPGYTPGPREDMELWTAEVGGDFFRLLGIPVVRGRELAAGEQSARPVVLVNEAMAWRYWRGRDPVGTRVRTGSGEAEVVGIVKDARYYAVSEAPVPMLFVQRPLAGYALFVRAAAPPRAASGAVADAAALAPAVRAALRELDPSLALDRAATMPDVLRDQLEPARAGASALAAFGLLALLLAAVGLYGVMAFQVAQRTREIGVRMALGARHGDVARLIVGETMRVTAIGAAVGVALAVLAGFAMRAALYGVSPADPIILGAVVLALAVTALLASALPARRAARVDPVEALRAE
jgi:predicted permease